MITAPPTLPPTEAAPVIQEVQEIVVETTPTAAAAAPILETRLAISPLIDSNKGRITVVL